MLAAFVAVMGLVSSCGSSKQVATEETYETPCSGPEYRTDAKTFREKGQGIAGNEDAARRAATSSARIALAESINTTVKAVTDNYVKTYVDGENADTKGRFEQLGRNVVNQKLAGSHVICEKYKKSTVNGKNTYTCYIVVELASEDVLAALNSQISNDTKLRTDYDYEKFKKTFEEEMAKMQ